METIGSFNYTKTINGNIVGEFVNHHHGRAFAECSELISENADNQIFDGNYKSIWQEDGIPILSKLKIERSSNSKFSLEWLNNENNEPIFRGEGFLISNNQMSGYYYSVD